MDNANNTENTETDVKDSSNQNTQNSDVKDSKDQVKNAENHLENKQDNDKQNDNEDQDSLTKKIEKMRLRINSEAGQKNQYKDQVDQLKKANETLSQKLDRLTNKDAQDKQNKDVDPALSAAKKENEELKAQITRINQMKTVSSQFNKAGVSIPEDILALVVPNHTDEKTISNNMGALSAFYDSIVASVKKSFLSSNTPRVTGTDNKPFDRSELSKIKDPVKRIQFIKEHINEFK